MFSSQYTKLFVAAWVATSLLLFPSLSRFGHAQSPKPSRETTNIVVVVKEYDTGQPISQARITLQFTVPGSTSRFGKSKKISYGAKTNAEGRYKFMDINKGAIVLTITAAGHQSYGKELQLEKDNQVFEIKLKKPQPLV
jgi:hypothetical protein